jgi:hypothetical protein
VSADIEAARLAVARHCWREIRKIRDAGDGMAGQDLRTVSVSLPGGGTMQATVTEAKARLLRELEAVAVHLPSAARLAVGGAMEPPERRLPW